MRRVFAAVTCFGVLSLGACDGSGSVVPSPLPDPSGTYSASEFTVVTATDTIDELAAGVTIHITLAPDGSTTGSFFVPEAGPDPLDLGGAWSLNGDVVTFHAQAVDNVIQHIQFHVGPDRLQGETTPGTIRITLSR